MRIEFITRDSGPKGLVCEAELIFEQETPLLGMKLVGVSVWRNAEGELYCTLPARSFGAGSDRRYFDFLRTTDGDADVARRLKAMVVEAATAWLHAQKRS